jgi:hypothetical protein
MAAVPLYLTSAFQVEHGDGEWGMGNGGWTEYKRLKNTTSGLMK